MKRRVHISVKSNIYPPEVKKSLFLFNGFFFLLLLLFAACLIFISSVLSRSVGRSPANKSDILLEYLTASLPVNADDMFIENIDAPMEELFGSSMLTNFYFSTEQYPVDDELFPYLQNSLSTYVENNKYTVGAVAYASTTNAYVTSNNISSEQNPEMKNALDDMIYRYNSNTLDRTQIADRKSNTFLFQYDGQLVISKDLTTLAGTPHAILFTFLDTEEFASSIYKSISSVSYKVSVYDSFNKLIYSNNNRKEEEIAGYLASLSTKGNPIEHAGDHHFIYCHSNVLNLQYILEIKQADLSLNPANPLLYYGITILAVVILSLLMAIGLYFFLGKPTSRLISLFPSSDSETSVLPSRTLASLSLEVENTLQENLTLRKIVAATSSEAVTSLFSRLIAGQKIEEEEAGITLENTDYGFQLNDIYIAGILYHSGQDFLSAENRYRTLNLLTAAFKEFKKKNEVSLCAFQYDDRTIAIIASFVTGTSIAKGKTRINALKEQINETLSYSNISMMLTFGNMYSSILDLSFSYNEAFRGIHYMVEAVSVSHAAAMETKLMPDSYPEIYEPAANDTASASLAVSPEKYREEDNGLSPQDFLELIYRRAEQIAKLIWDGKDDQVESLITRTIDDIIQYGALPDQCNNCKRLVSAVTSHMLSYPFVSDTHLSDVYNELSVKLKDENISSDELRENVQHALFILCEDFSETLKKQRNPYIMAAQEYIKQNYSSPELTLEGIAEYLKIAPNYLSTIFSKNLGKRLFEYINEYRLEQSIELLLNTTKSINDIGEESGFGSSRNYIRIFKKYKGLPPGAYRKQHQEQRPATDSEEVSNESTSK